MGINKTKTQDFLLKAYKEKRTLPAPMALKKAPLAHQNSLQLKA
tara:strand:+ start:584 stop:715 length:132 start_codon:yes stop_codon:yes gene_type:complete